METSQDLISAVECWELLARVSVGRIALSVRALPMIVPAQYYLDGRMLAICLGHRELPERSLNAVVAFAADAIDPVTRSGWSVHVLGRSVMSRQFGMDTACGRPTAGQIVHIEPETIFGYRVHLCPFIDSFLAGPDGGGIRRPITPRC